MKGPQRASGRLSPHRGCAESGLQCDFIFVYDKSKAFGSFQVHLRPLATKESGDCYDFASVDHMGGSAT